MNIGGVNNSVRLQGNNIEPIVKVLKVSDNSKINAGGEISYTVKIENFGEADVESVNLVDTLSDNVNFVKGTVKIDNISAPEIESLDNINLGVIKAGETTDISYKVKVPINISFGEAEEIIIENMAKIEYDFSLYPSNNTDKKFKGVKESNKVKVTVLKPKFKINKTVDKDKSYPGDILTYTITLKNTGDIPTSNILVSDPITNEMLFYQNDSLSVMKDNKEIDFIGKGIEEGILIKEIKNGEEIKINWKAKINEDITEDITNTAKIKINGEEINKIYLEEGSGLTAKTTIVCPKITLDKKITAENKEDI